MIELIIYKSRSKEKTYMSIYTPLRHDNFFFYESRKRELKTRLIYEDRCDERLKPRVNLRNLHSSHTLGCTILPVIHT
jgi:hypothetical protein